MPKIIFLLSVLFIFSNTAAADNLDCKQRIEILFNQEGIVSNNLIKELVEKFSGNLYLRDKDLLSCSYSNSKTGVNLKVELADETLKTIVTHEYFKSSKYSGDYTRKTIELVSSSGSLLGDQQSDVYVTYEEYYSGCGFAECNEEVFIEEPRKKLDTSVSFLIK